MRALYHLSLVTACLGLGQIRAQQQLLQQQVQPQVLYYNFQGLSGPSAPFVQNMLREINPTNFNRSGFELHYNQEFRVFRNMNGGLVNVQMQISQVRVLNLGQFKGFDFADVFRPERFKPTVKLMRSTGELLVEQALDYQLVDSLGNTPLFVFNYTDSLAGRTDYFFEFSNTFIEYTQQSQQKVKNKVQQVNEYERSLQELINFEARVKTFPMQGCDPDSINFWQQQYEAFNRDAQPFWRRSFWQGLGLMRVNAFDPLNLLPLRQGIEQLLAQQQERLNYWRNNRHELFYLRARRAYRGAASPQVRSACDEALKLSPQYAPALALRAKNANHDRQYLDAKRDLMAAMQATAVGLDAQVQQEVLLIHPQVVTALDNMARQQVQAKAYAQALNLFNEALDLCLRTPGINTCNSQGLEQGRYDLLFQWFEEGRSNAQTRISTANGHLQAQRYEACQTEALIAKDSARSLKTLYVAYPQDLQNRVVNPDGIYDQALDLEYQAIHLGGEGLLAAKQKEKALPKAQALLDLIKVEPSLQTRLPQANDFMERVQYAFFQSHVAKGDSLQNAQKFPEAKAAYALAQALDNQYMFSQKGLGQGLGDKVAAAMQASIIERANAQLGNTDNAALRNHIRELRADQDKYPALKQGPAEMAIQQLEARICTNAKTLLYPKALQEVQQARQSKDYILALQRYNAGVALVQEYQNCQIEASELYGLSLEIQTCAAFQEEAKVLANQEQMQQFKQALQSAAKLKEKYVGTPVLNSNLPALPIFDLQTYLRNHGNRVYVYEGSFWFLNENNNEVAFELLRRSLEMGMPAKQTRFVQERLGTWKAEQVFDRTRRAKDVFPEVVGPNQRPWSAFRKTFNRRWKQLGGK